LLEHAVDEPRLCVFGPVGDMETVTVDKSLALRTHSPQVPAVHTLTP
jgi:hypothetical protein